MKEITIKLMKVKDTKRMTMFEEKPNPGVAPVVRNIYVEQWFVQGATEIEVTIKVKN